jgi:CRP/FNR family transcriptional regulator, cyclic AMP receptor protein
VQWRILEGLPEEEARRLLSRTRRRRFARGETLFHEGDPGTTVHLVAKGRIAVRVTTPMGEVATVELVLPGDVVGELALLSAEGLRGASAVALEPTETLALDKETFIALRRDDPLVSDFLVQLLAARVRRLTHRLLEALYLPADVRLLRRLLELADVYGDVIPLIQEDLAGLAGTTRATVNRVLRRELARGTLELTRGRVTVIDRESLARRSR